MISPMQVDSEPLAVIGSDDVGMPSIVRAALGGGRHRRRPERRRPRVGRLVTLGVVLVAALGCVARATAAPVSPRVRAVALPRDHGAHAGFQVEWWYTAGTVADSSGHPYFWFATVWATGQGMTARVNVVDLRRDRIVLARQYLSATPAAGGQRSMRFGTFSLGWRPGGALGRWSADATTPGGRLVLSLRPGQAYVLHGVHGIIQQGSGGPSAYYSEPRLAARGVLELGRRRIAVHGEGWLDHQWATSRAIPERCGGTGSRVSCATDAT